MQLETPLNTSEGASQGEEKSQRFDHSSAEVGIDSIQVALLLWQNKKTIFRIAVATSFLTALIVFFVLKATYTANAVFLPPQSPPGSAMSQVAGQLGSLGAIGALGGLKSPGDVYIGILGSRTIADALIQRFDLQRVYKTKRLSDTEKELKGNTKFVYGKDSLVVISVEDRDPRRAANLANGYLDSLREQNGRLALTDSAQRRVFFEQQLVREKDALADAEVELKRTQEQTGIIAPVGQAEVAIEAIQQLRAQITSRQVELSVLQQGATNQNPAVVRTQAEIENLQEQLRKLESDSSQRNPGSVQAPTSKVPDLTLQYIRKLREVKYHETLFQLLARQYEQARLDESREAPLLQVVDKAIVPDKKSGPHRALLVLAGMFVGLVAGAVWVILSTSLKNRNRGSVSSV